MFQKKDSLLMFLLFLSSFIPLLFSMPYAPSSNTKSFNYTYDCSYLFSETSTCDLLNLTFANEVFSNSFESNLEAINNFIEESYIFKKKFCFSVGLEIFFSFSISFSRCYKTKYRLEVKY